MPYIYKYKIENLINNKLYIGKTIYTIKRRWYQHRTNSKREEYKHMPIYSAFNKYGLKNFSVSCVEEVDDISILSEREKYWIKYYDSYNHGYNATLGGDGALLYDYDTIWELWEAGYTIKQISKQIGCNDFVVRTVLDIHGVTTQERIDRSYNDQIASHIPFQRSVNKIDIDTGVIVETYSSVSEAARTIGYDSSSLSKICKRSGIAKGYKWQYVDQEYTKKDFSPQQVCQIDLKTNEVIQIFPSISAAARSVNGDSSYISKVCKGIQKSSKGFGWRYLDKMISTNNGLLQKETA